MLTDGDFGRVTRGEPSKQRGALALLTLSKSIRLVVAIGLLTLLNALSFPLWPFLFVALTATALVVNLVHKPWLRPLKTQHFLLAAGHGGLLLGTAFFWTLSLKYFGPVKTIILTELSDWWIPPLWLLCTNRSHLLSVTQIRGSIFVAVSVLILFIFSTAPEFPAQSTISPLDSNSPSQSNPPSPTVTYGGLGALSFITASLFILGRKTFSRNIQGRFRASALSTAPTKKDAGVKALSALGFAFAAAFSSIPAFFQYFFGQGSSSTFGYSFWMLIVSAFFVFIADFYTEGSSRSFLTRRIHVAVVMLPTLVLPITLYFFSYHSQMDLSTIIAFLGCIAGLIMLSNTKEDEDLLPTSDNPSASDSFRFNVAEFGLQKILAEPDSRKIFIFLCANLSFMFVELVYGYITNSLGLISDAFHMLFDCTALAIGLYASLMKHWPADRDYTYGYGRVQILSGFANGIFLCFIAFSVFIEAVKRIYEPPEIFTEKLILVSTLGFCVNLVGLYAFHDHSGHSHGGKKEKDHDDHGHSHEHKHDKGKQKEKKHHDHDGHDHDDHHGHSHDKGKHEHEDDEHDDNMYGVFLHVLADTLGSVGVIASSTLIHFFDPIASLIISLLIGLSVIPLLKSTAKTLLQGIPPPIAKSYDKCVEKIKKIEGVIDVASPHFWSHTQTQIVGTAVIVIYEGFDSQEILRKSLAIFNKFGVHDMTIQIETYHQTNSVSSNSYDNLNHS